MNTERERGEEGEAEKENGENDEIIMEKSCL